jgi:hypothetical protein
VVRDHVVQLAGDRRALLQTVTARRARAAKNTIGTEFVPKPECPQPKKFSTTMPYTAVSTHIHAAVRGRVRTATIVRTNR